MTQASTAVLARLVGALVCVALTSCIEEKCDPGYRAQRGACYPIPDDAGGPGPSDARAPDADAGARAAAAPACAHGEGFGATCAADTDCTCETRCIPVLAICSVLNCASTPEVCPEGWQCQDISASSPDPSVSSICLAMP